MRTDSLWHDWRVLCAHGCFWNIWKWYWALCKFFSLSHHEVYWCADIWSSVIQINLPVSTGSVVRMTPRRWNEEREERMRDLWQGERARLYERRKWLLLYFQSDFFKVKCSRSRQTWRKTIHGWFSIILVCESEACGWWWLVVCFQICTVKRFFHIHVLMQNNLPFRGFSLFQAGSWCLHVSGAHIGLIGSWVIQHAVVRHLPLFCVVWSQSCLPHLDDRELFKPS